MDIAHPASDSVYDVAIIGAGFSGSLTAIHLLSDPPAGEQPLRVALIEKESTAFGRGVAYGTPCTRYLLNVPAGKMGAFPTGWRRSDKYRWPDGKRGRAMLRRVGRWEFAARQTSRACAGDVSARRPPTARHAVSPQPTLPVLPLVRRNA